MADRSGQDRNCGGAFLSRESEVRILPGALPKVLQTSGKEQSPAFAPRLHYTNFYTNTGNLIVNSATHRVVSLKGAPPVPTLITPRTSDVRRSPKLARWTFSEVLEVGCLVVVTRPYKIARPKWYPGPMTLGHLSPYGALGR